MTSCGFPVHSGERRSAGDIYSKKHPARAPLRRYHDSDQVPWLMTKCQQDRNAAKGLSRIMRRQHAPLLLAAALVGTVLGGLLVGYEHLLAADPDRLYRPLKSRAGPGVRAKDDCLFWSHRLGLGVPLVAESHVAAFYPPNIVLYRVLDVPTAYRLSMWLHYLALVATTYFYARGLGVLPWGAAMAAP